MNLTRPALLFFICALLLRAITAQTPTPTATQPIPVNVARQMFEETNVYFSTRAAELTKRNPRPDPKEIGKLREEQKALASNYIEKMQGAGPQTGDNLYYLGRLQQLAAKDEDALTSLRLFLVMNSDNPLAESARPVAISCALNRKLVAEAEQLLDDYQNKQPENFMERAGIERYFSQVYRAAADFDSMVRHARSMYKIIRRAMNDKKCKPGECEPVLVDAVGLVADGYLKQNRPDEALAVFNRLQRFALNRPSVYLFGLASIRLANFNPAYDPYRVFDEPADGTQNLPELKIADWIDMQPAKFSDLEGRVVLLDFWATWCGPCRMAFPDLRKWHTTYQAKGLVIIGVTKYFGNVAGQKSTHDQELAYLRTFKKRNELPYGFAVGDTDHDALNYGVFGIPSYVLIDRAGHIRAMGLGGGPSNNSLDKMIKKLIEEPPPAPLDSSKP